MSAPRIRRYTDQPEMMRDMETFARWGIGATITSDPPAWCVTIVSWPFSDNVRLVVPYDPQPLEDDHQESRWWDEFGQSGLGRSRHLNDADD